MPTPATVDLKTKHRRAEALERIQRLQARVSAGSKTLTAEQGGDRRRA